MPPSKGDLSRKIDYSSMLMDTNMPVLWFFIGFVESHPKRKVELLGQFFEGLDGKGRS